MITFNGLVKILGDRFWIK